MERELGHELFDRSSRALNLTEFGKALRPLAEMALQTVDKIRLAADAMAGELCGRLAVGAVAHPLPLLADALAVFHHAHPAVSITLTEARSDQLMAAVLERQLDMAIVGQAASSPPQLCEQLLAPQNIVAIVHDDDPLADRASIALGDLRDRALISHPQGSGIRAILDRACMAAGFAPNIVFETSSVDMMGHLVTRDLGVAVAPELPRERLDRIQQIHLSDQVMRGRLALVWRGQGATLETEAFAAYVSELCGADDTRVGAP